MNRLRIVLTLIITSIFPSLTSHSYSLAVSHQDKGDDTEIEWTPCPLKTGNEKVMAECTLITVPMHHKKPGGAVIKVAVKRKLGKIPNKRQLWFLDGGPGDSGRESLAALVKVFSDFDDLDLYTFDHRGVGGTQLLDCPEQQRPDSGGGREIVAKEWKYCIQYLQEHRDDLDVLTTTETARDLDFSSNCSGSRTSLCLLWVSHTEAIWPTGISSFSRINRTE